MRPRPTAYAGAVAIATLVLLIPYADILLSHWGSGVSETAGTALAFGGAIALAWIHRRDLRGTCEHPGAGLTAEGTQCDGDTPGLAFTGINPAAAMTLASLLLAVGLGFWATGHRIREPEFY